MFEISKKFKFDASHMIKDHFHKCKNLHGHTYSIEVFFETKHIDLESGVMIDYYDIGKIMKPIIDQLDHSFMYFIEDPIQCEIAEILIENNMKVNPFEFQTTAEMLARYFTKELYSKLDFYGFDIEKINIKVIIKETENTTAKYEI